MTIYIELSPKLFDLNPLSPKLFVLNPLVSIFTMVLLADGQRDKLVDDSAITSATDVRVTKWTGVWAVVLMCQNHYVFFGNFLFVFMILTTRSGWYRNDIGSG